MTWMGYGEWSPYPWMGYGHVTHTPQHVTARDACSAEDLCNLADCLQMQAPHPPTHPRSHTRTRT